MKTPLTTAPRQVLSINLDLNFQNPQRVFKDWMKLQAVDSQQVVQRSCVGVRVAEKPGADPHLARPLSHSCHGCQYGCVGGVGGGALGGSVPGKIRLGIPVGESAVAHRRHEGNARNPPWENHLMRQRKMLVRIPAESHLLPRAHGVGQGRDAGSQAVPYGDFNHVDQTAMILAMIWLLSAAVPGSTLPTYMPLRQ